MADDFKDFNDFLNKYRQSESGKNFDNIVSKEESKLSSLYKNQVKLEEFKTKQAELEKQRIEALKNNNKEAYNSALKDLNKLNKAKENLEKKIHDQAVKNVVALQEKKEKLLEKEKNLIIEAQKNRIENEKKIADLDKKTRNAKTIEDKKKYAEEEAALRKQKEQQDAFIKQKQKEVLLDKDRLKAVEKITKEAQREYNLSKSLRAGPSMGNKIEGAKLHTSTKSQEYASLLKLKLEERDELGRQGLLDSATLSSYNKETNKLKLKELGWGTLDNALESLSKSIEKGINNSLSKVDQAIEDATSHRTKIMARLQGFGGDEYDYNSLLKIVSSNLAVSPYIQAKDYMKTLDEAVNKGIAYNVEQRTFLATVKDEIATTFDAFDSSLMRIIRLQQADSTAARLGMEASLTKTLNAVFSDTSYLKDMYDNVTAAIVDSESLMTRDAATEFEYVVQKWMGALYSLGASNQLINQIAQGLNYIGTGNVKALASNSPLQTLFAMSASRATGLDYANLLVSGLDAKNTNELLKSMVQYLREIAEDNRANNVVKSAYGDIYSMSLADMRAITSLTSNDIESLYSSNLSYTNMTTELENQFSSIYKRLSFGEMIHNIMDNFVYTLGTEISSNAITYTLWQITDLIKEATGGIKLPAIEVMGNMVDLSAFTVEGIMQMGIVGVSTLARMGSILNSLANGGLDLSIWNAADTLQRGQINTQNVGSISTTSGSLAYRSSSSSEDMTKSSIAGATEEAGEVAEITNAGVETEHSFDDFYNALLVDHEPIYIKSFDDYTVSDLYTEMFLNKTPIPIYMDASSGIGNALLALSNLLVGSNKVIDINIKKSDISIPTKLDNFDDKLKEEIKTYIRNTYLEMLSEELKESLIGSSKGNNQATIAKVCDKILNEKVDVEVKNNNFDRFLDIQSGLFG